MPEFLTSRLLKFGTLSLIGCFPVLANASVVAFDPNFGTLNTTFPDGTFSSGLLSPSLGLTFPDGFYSISPTSAFNGNGANDEYIAFNSPITLNSLDVSSCGSHCQPNPVTTVTVELFNSASTLLTSQTWNYNSGARTLTFNTPNVSEVLFDITGTSNPFTINIPTDTRPFADFYQVGNINYTASAVPVPATSWLMLLGVAVTAGFTRRTRLTE